MSAALAMITKYLLAKYRDGARGEIEDGQVLYDCWGLARAARVELYGRKLLPSRGGEYQYDPVGFTRQYQKQASEMAEIESPVAGAIIAVLRRYTGVCMHVGLVVHDINNTGHGLHVLEINPQKNVILASLYRFKAAHALRVFKIYDDPCISQQA